MDISQKEPNQDKVQQITGQCLEVYVYQEQGTINSTNAVPQMLCKWIWKCNMEKQTFFPKKTFQMADMNIKKMLNITNKPGNASKNTIPFTLSPPKIKNLGITLTKCA